MKKTFILSAIAVLALSACNGLDQIPQNKYTDATYWANSDNLYNYVYRAYAQTFDATKHLFDINIVSDDAYGSQQTYSFRDISIGTAFDDSGEFGNIWSAAYQSLRSIHTILEHLPDASLTDAQKARVEAELRYLRAYNYYRMTVWYGDVQLFKENPTLEEARTGSRTAASEVRAYIHSELEDIQGKLPKNTDLPAGELGRATAGAAIALNARMYLYEGNYAKCASECEKLINGTSYGSYSLAPDYAQLFVDGYKGPEAIMTIGFSGTVSNVTRGWSINRYVPNSIGDGHANYSPTQELVNVYRKLDGSAAAAEDYADRDKRFYSTIVFNGAKVTFPAGKSISVKPDEGTTNVYTVYTKAADEAKVGDNNRVDSYAGPTNEDRTKTGYYQAKNYVASTVANNGNSYQTLMECRYAEILLAYAESKAKTGGMTVDVWNKTVKPIRERAGFDAAYCQMPSASGDALVDIIRDELRAECGLEGRRPIDLRRISLEKNPSLATSGGVYISHNPTGFNGDDGKPVTQTAAYATKFWFAVPKQQRLINPNLGFNPGWTE